MAGEELVPRPDAAPEVANVTALPVVQLVMGTASQANLAPLPGIVGAIAEAAPHGDLLRVIGPSDLVRGLHAGTVKYMQSGDLLRGTVIDPNSKQIVGQVQMVRSSVSMGVAALGVFQVASLVTGQYYLHAITEQLGAIQQSVDRLTSYLQHGADAKLDATEEIAEELERLFEVAGILEQRDWVRLNAADESASTAYFHALRVAQGTAAGWVALAEQLDDAIARSGTAHPARVGTIKGGLGALNQEIDDLAGHLHRLSRAARLVVRLRLLRVIAELAADESRGDRFRSELSRTLVERAEELAALHRDLQSLSGPTDKDLSRLFAFDGKPKKGMNGYRDHLLPIAESFGAIPAALNALRSQELEVLDAQGSTTVPPLALGA